MLAILYVPGQPSEERPPALPPFRHSVPPFRPTPAVYQDREGGERSIPSILRSCLRGSQELRRELRKSVLAKIIIKGKRMATAQPFHHGKARGIGIRDVFIRVRSNDLPRLLLITARCSSRALTRTIVVVECS
jgi:hypothetical protein